MSSTNSILDYISDQSINTIEKQNQDLEQKQPDQDLKKDQPKKEKRKRKVPAWVGFLNILTKNQKPIFSTIEKFKALNDSRSKTSDAYKNKLSLLQLEYKDKLAKLAKLDKQINKNITDTKISYKKSGIALDSPYAKNQLSTLPKDTTRQRKDLYKEYELKHQQLVKPESTPPFSVFTIPKIILGELSGFNFRPKL